MFEDISTTGFKYPKTLVIRNTVGGAIWQIYHVDNVYQALYISKGAKANCFEGRTLEDYQPNEEETFPNWRMEIARSFIKMLPDHLVLSGEAVDIPVPNEEEYY
jgi:hypothetical protein